MVVSRLNASHEVTKHARTQCMLQVICAASSKLPCLVLDAIRIYSHALMCLSPEFEIYW